MRNYTQGHSYESERIVRDSGIEHNLHEFENPRMEQGAAMKSRDKMIGAGIGMAALAAVGAQLYWMGYT